MYKVRSGLTKTVIYQLCVDYLFDKVLLPSKRKCSFKRYRNSYWLSFISDDFCKYEVYVSAFSFEFFLHLEKFVYLEDSDEYEMLERSIIKVPVDYLVEHNFLREVTVSKR